MKTHEIINRKIKKPSTFKESKWEYEIGDGLEKAGEEPILLKSNNAVLFHLLSQFSSERTHWTVINGEFETFPTQLRPIFLKSTLSSSKS